MTDPRKNRTSGQTDPREPASPTRAPARTAQPWQRPVPSIQSPDGSVSSPGLPQPSPPQRGAKVQIPRLRRETDGPSANTSSTGSDPKNRVSHACEPCRHRKTKCSGERPICKHCQDFKIQCNYADGKRDRTKKEYNIMAARVSECEDLLRDISARLGEADQQLIRGMLEKDLPYGQEDYSTPGSFRRRRTSDEGDAQSFRTEHQATGRAGSTDSLDCINEDFNRSDASRTTGFMGKNSEVAWMEKLRRETDGGADEDDEDDRNMGFGSGLDESHEDPTKTVGKPLNESSYHCDDIPLSADEDVQPYQVPPRANADLLLTCYLEAVHPNFPILGKTTFVKQYRAFYDNPNLKTGPRWLAVLNLIFAIGARYSHLVRAEWSHNTDDHETFFARARLLSLDSSTILTPPELQRIQIYGLASFYLMATHQINRSYAMSGIAIRQALTLGLNLLNSDKKLMDSSKEIRYRLWWAIASTERALSVMTGRPTCFVGTDCSAPLPLPLEEESFMSTNESYETPAVRSLRRFSTEESNLADGAVSTPASISSKGAPMSPRESLHSRRSQMESESEGVNPSNGLFFLYITKLSCLNDNIMRQLYRPPVMEQSWATVQSLITGAQKKLMRWHATLPGVFDFTKSQRDQSFLRQRMCLGFSYYSTMILINRPSLCKIDERIPNETKRAKDTDRASAVSCVLAAKSLVDLLPDEPNPVGTYQVSLWWNIVHHLMQAATVLMLEMSLRATHCPDMPDDLMNAAQKAVAWLQSMSADDLAAARAWRMSSDVLRKVAPKIGRKMDDRLTRPVQSGGEMSMQDLLMPDGDYPMPGPSDYGPTSGDLFAGYPPITSWEPLMFTSYDNYLSGGDPSGHQQGPSHNQWG